MNHPGSKLLLFAFLLSFVLLAGCSDGEGDAEGGAGADSTEVAQGDEASDKKDDDKKKKKSRERSTTVNAATGAAPPLTSAHVSLVIQNISNVRHHCSSNTVRFCLCGLYVHVQCLALSLSL